jgi:hypothetical protein
MTEFVTLTLCPDPKVGSTRRGGMGGGWGVKDKKREGSVALEHGGGGGGGNRRGDLYTGTFDWQVRGEKEQGVTIGGRSKMKKEFLICYLVNYLATVLLCKLSFKLPRLQ